MFKKLTNSLSGNAFLNDATIIEEAKKDAEDRLVLENDIPTIIEQKLIDHYQSQIFKLKAKRSEKLYQIISTEDVSKIDSYIIECAQEEDRLIKEAQAASNVYRREYFKNISDKTKIGLTLNVNKLMIRVFDLPSEIRSLYGYQAALQAKEDASYVDSKQRTYEECFTSFEKKATNLAQELINDFYQKSERLPTLLERFEQKTITKAQLQDSINALKANEQNILNKITDTLYLYKNVLNSSFVKLEADPIPFTAVEHSDIRPKLRLHYDVNLDIESVEELSILDKAQNDALSGAELFQLDGSFSTYELYLRDQYQEKINANQKLLGVQYRYLEDEEYLNQEENNPSEVTHNYYNPVIIENGIAFETLIHSRFIKLINLYRSELLRLKKADENTDSTTTRLNFYPVLTFYFKNMENETLTVQDINAAATEDAALFQNKLDKTTPYMFYIQKKFQKQLESNYKSCMQQLSELNSETNNESSENELLLTEYKENENLIINQYNEFQLIYLREFINRKRTIEIDDALSINSESLELIPPLSPYFDGMSFKKESLSDEKIVQMAQDDAANQIGSKVFPDFTYSEKAIRNTFQELLNSASNNTMIIIEEKMPNNANLEVEYHSKIDLYRQSYIVAASPDENSSKFFQAGYLPLVGLTPKKEDFLPDSYTDLEIVQSAIIDVKNGMEACTFIKKVINDYRFYFEQNYRHFLQTGIGKVEIVTGHAVENITAPEYHTHSNIEGMLLQNMHTIITRYLELFSLYSNAVGKAYDTNTSAACFSVIELHFDTDVTEEKIIRQAQLDLAINVSNTPTLYQKKIISFYQRKIFELELSYIDKTKQAKDQYIQTGNNQDLKMIRSKEPMEKEMLKSEYLQMMNLYLSENTHIQGYKIPSLS